MVDFKRALEAERKLKQWLEEKHGLSEHPKKDLLFHLAWEHGHSAGYHEVESYYDDFSRLLK